MQLYFPNIEKPATSMVNLLRTRADTHGDRLAFSFLQDGEEEVARLDYETLDQEARRIAAILQERGLGAQGERVLLYFPAGPDFLTAFLGCLYAGVVAVPTSPPLPHRSAARLHSVIRDTRAAAVLTHSSMLPGLRAHLDSLELAGSLSCIAVDSLPDIDSEQWRPFVSDEETLAFLQYTSGSTSTPKGVMVTHGNLLHNTLMIQTAFEQTSDSVIVSWLPLFHDMGLIGQALNALTLGSHCVLMAPDAFLMKPVRWLRAISRFGAHTSGGPNFGFELCVRKVRAEQAEGLDLGGWHLAFNGSERVRPHTMERFYDRFSPLGFQAKAMFPCYGLAECTLYASGGVRQTLAKRQSFDAVALEAGRAEVNRESCPRSIELVSCGAATLGQEIRVIHSETHAPLEEGVVGEVWLAGPSCAAGYWNRPQETQSLFKAKTADGEGPYLRTGDLGFLLDEELYLTGRLKDLIIITGRNHHPEDIEHTVESSHPAIRPGCVAAFSCEEEGEERLCLALEVTRELEQVPRAPGQADGADAQGWAPVEKAIRKAVAIGHDLKVHSISVLEAGTLPKTSSGKVQRQACRQAVLEGNNHRLRTSI
jgi:acyl-CoA synthetase (AMP-forming)/AMP-acid ligase II